MKTLFLCTLLLTLVSCNKSNPSRSTFYEYKIPVHLSDGISVGDASDNGIDTVRLRKLTQYILSDTIPNIHSLLILKDNKLVYENYFAGEDEKVGKGLGYISHSVTDLHDCRSITKSVTSICIGISIKKGLIKDEDEPISNYFGSEYAFEGSRKDITIRHLLNMTSGLKWNEDISYRDPRNTELRMDWSSDPVGFVLGRNMENEPGSVWNYNGGNTQLLAEIIKIVSGLSLDKFATKELFEPLGINNYEWIKLRNNAPAAASGLRLKSRDLAKIGLVMMNDGFWGEKQIVTKEWVDESFKSGIKRPSQKDQNPGYGFQFWTWSEAPYHFQEAKGNGGQRIFFCKELKLLAIITAGNYNNWNIKNDSKALLVDYILPALL